jgi:hypothetical protein
MAASTAHDPTTAGPFKAKSGDYKFPAKIDSLVTTFLETELWARVWYPTGKAFSTAPLVILVHGNHGTCGHKSGQFRIDDRTDYSTTGKCPSGYVVTPNHTGYDYVASRLATRGYVVVSINSNRGITAAPEDSRENDPGLIQRRGRMILRHLMLLGQWNKSGGQPSSVGFNFKGKLNFSKVTLFGHSRGGDGIIAAYNLYKTSSTWRARLPKITFVGVASMAPTDFQVNAPKVIGAPLAMLLPMCDGDVNRLSGIHFYDRSIVNSTPDTAKNFKAVFATWGANHDGYNTQWQTDDQYQAASRGCPDQNQLFKFPIGLSTKQQTIGRYYLMGVARGGSESSIYSQIFNPAFKLPSGLKSVTRIDRSFFAGRGKKSLRLVHFNVANCASIYSIFGGVHGECSAFPEHQPDPGGLARWGAPVSTPQNANYSIFTLNGGKLANLSLYRTLDLRVGPDCKRLGTTQAQVFACVDQSVVGVGSPGSQNVYLYLEDAHGNFSKPVSLQSYIERRQAVGAHVSGNVLPVDPLFHALLSSARIPLSVFKTSGFTLAAVKRLWVYLGDQNSSGGLFFGDVWAVTSPTTNITAAVTPAEEEADAVAEDGEPPAEEAAASLPPPPPRNAALTPVQGAAGGDAIGTQAAPAAVIPAEPGNRILSATRGSLQVAVDNPPEGVAADAVPTRAVPTVSFTLSTTRQIVEGDSGVQVRIGNSLIQGRRFGTGHENDAPSVTTVVVPAAAVDGSADGASVTVLAGGGTWQFGPLNKGAIR